MNFLVLKGDGIGPEIVDATLDVVKKISIKDSDYFEGCGRYAITSFFGCKDKWQENQK